MKDLRLEGEWWIPGGENNKIGGTLIFTQEDGSILRLLGGFKPIEFDHLNHPAIPIILGTAEGKSITLELCLFKGSENFGVGQNLSSYIVHRIYLGLHVQTAEALQFKSVQLFATYMFDWFHTTGVERGLARDDDHVGVYTLRYSPPHDLAINLPDGVMTVGFELKVSQQGMNSILNEVVSAKYESHQNRSLLELLNNFWSPLRCFLTLGTGRSNFLDKLHLFTEEHPEVEIECFFYQQFYEPRREKPLVAYEMFFSYPQIASSFAEKIMYWFGAFAELDAVMNLFMREINAPGLYQELKFLTIVHALETYHLRRYARNFVLDDDGQDRITRILQAVAYEDRNWLRERLANVTAKSLKLRMDELINDKIDLIEPLVSDLDKLTSKIRDSRNYFTHFGRETKRKAADGEMLNWLTRVLSILLKSCLLDEIQISVPKQIEWFQDDWEYNYVARNATAFRDYLTQAERV